MRPRHCAKLSKYESMSDLFQQSEKLADGSRIAAEQLWTALSFDERGLIPIIAQCTHSKIVLMQAWGNLQTLQLSLSSGQMHYYSRSRARVWRKGESSGHTQRLIELRADCDGDSLLAIVEQLGPACHTNRKDCFYWLFDAEGLLLQPIITSSCGK